MRIQFGHTRDFDFENELYLPVRRSGLWNEHDILLPYSGEPPDSRETLKTQDLFVAEVSFPSTGLGIELGFASLYGVPILCVYRQGTRLSNSLRFVTDSFLEYATSDELVDGIADRVQDLRS